MNISTFPTEPTQDDRRVPTPQRERTVPVTLGRVLRALVYLRIELLYDEWCDASEPFSLGLRRAAQQLDVVLDATEGDADQRRLRVIRAWCDDMLLSHQPSTQFAGGYRTVVKNVRSALDVWS